MKALDRQDIGLKHWAVDVEELFLVALFTPPSGITIMVNLLTLFDPEKIVNMLHRMTEATVNPEHIGELFLAIDRILYPRSAYSMSACSLRARLKCIVAQEKQKKQWRSNHAQWNARRGMEETP